MNFSFCGLLSVSDGAAVFDLLQKNRRNNAPNQNSSWTDKQVLEELGVSLAFGVWRFSSLTGVLFLRVGLEDLEITYLTTDFGVRRQGVMSFLLRSATRVFQNHRFCLEVHQDNSQAIGFYEKMGFQLDGSRPRYYQDGKACRLYSLKPPIR